MIYTHTPITLKIVLKWFLFIGLINLLFALFFWLLDREISFSAHFLQGSLTAWSTLLFSALPLIFLKNAKPVLRLLMVFASCIAGTIAGLILNSIYLYQLSYGLFMFLFIMNMMIVSIIVGFLYYWEGIAVTNSRLEEERIKRLDMEKQVVQTKLRLVQAPIEPNFLFNTLKQVIRLLDQDIAKAKNLQLKLIQYLRLSLSKLKKETHTVAREMEMIRSYLDILKNHPGNPTGYEFDLPQNIYGRQIPPMLLHVVIENIVDYLHSSGCTPGKLLFKGEEMKDGMQFELTVSGNEDDILLTFRDIREKFHKTFGNKASLLLKTGIPANLKIILKFKTCA